MPEFNQFAPSAPAVFYRSYSRRKEDGSRESFEEAITRTISAIAEIGKFSEEQKSMALEMGLKQHCFPSGRALWVAGTEWAKRPDNYPGYYNCCSMHVDNVSVFGLLMELAMMGTGTGAVLEQDVVDSLPPIRRALFVEAVKHNEGAEGGDPDTRIELMGVHEENPIILVRVGDSREGWASAYQGLIELAMGRAAQFEEEDTTGVDASIILDLSQIRQAGEPLKGFGGTANPVRLQDTLENAIQLTQKAAGRKLTPLECCLLIDEAASAVVAGNIRRSAGMRQFSAEDSEAACAKDNLYQQDEDGNWSVDPEKECLRMANHTRCFHHKPTFEEVSDSVKKQFWSGEGAIQYVPEMLARANADLLDTDAKRAKFLNTYALKGRSEAQSFIHSLAVEAGEQSDDIIIKHRMQRYGLNPCVTGDTPILTYYDGIKTFDQLAEAGEDVAVWCFDQLNNRPIVSVMRKPRITSESKPLMAVHFENGSIVRCTHDHKFCMANGDRVRADELNAGDIVAGFRMRHTPDLPREKRPGFRPMIRLVDQVVSRIASGGVGPVYNGTVDGYSNYIIASDLDTKRMVVNGIVSANCGEIALKDNLCNLSEIHLNTIDPDDKKTQHEAFYVGGLQVAALLQHEFTQERLNYSRKVDPIVGVSFTGLFDFFVHAFGRKWLAWMMKGCPTGKLYGLYDNAERIFLNSWRESAQRGVVDYCSQHGIRVPNRFTTVQPAGSKSLLTGASPGWHPPKAQRFIRRITFGVNDPLVSALRDYGYNVIPAQSARDEKGNLLDDITDPRVQEVLVEIPTEVSWARLPGCDEFDLSKLPVESQWRLYMQVQKTYTTHNTSATLEFRENEIETLSRLMYSSITLDEGYISAALLARFDANETFPRLPFEPIDNEVYERRMAVVNAVRSTLPEDTTVLDLLKKYDDAAYELKGAAGCDSDKCLSEEKPKK